MLFWKRKSRILDSAMIEVGHEIERCLFVWELVIGNHWEDMENNSYHKAIEFYVTNILNDETLSNEERIDGATKSLDISEHYRKKINDTCFCYIDFLKDKITQFEEMSELLPEVAKFKAKEWVQFSKALYIIRQKQLLAINKHIDTDKFMAQLIIDNNGNSKIEPSDQERFLEICTSYANLQKDAIEEENNIKNDKNKTSEELLGSYAKFIKDGSYNRLINIFKTA